MSFDLPIPQTVTATISISDFPIEAALHNGPKALAIITGIEGASYRPLGAVMVCDQKGNRHGSLSSGCIEKDVALHCVEALRDGQSRRLRYGSRSPFMDLQLPCGGGLDVLIVPNPDPSALARVASDMANRETSTLQFENISLTIEPDIRFIIFGKGPETQALSRLAQSAGYLVETYSPDPETLADIDGHFLPSPRWPEGLCPDRRSAICLFFHDHDWEPPILAEALASEAFYIGAQGSRRAHEARCEALMHYGVPPDALTRIAAPFGLIPSVRDPKTLAVSVLSHVLAKAQTKGKIGSIT